MLLPLAILGLAWATPQHFGQPLAEAWLTVDDHADLDRARSVGIGLAEGVVRRADGRFDVRVLVAPPAAVELAELGYSLRFEPGLRDDDAVGYSTPEDADGALLALARSARRGGLVQLGLSRKERPILGLWLGRPPHSGVPAVRVLAGHHGDERPAVELALAVAAAMVAGDGEDDAITEILDDRTIWIVPMVNPDGVASSTRLNAAGIDLNRNYDVEWSASEFRSGDSPFSEPETRSIRTHAWFNTPALGLSLHTGATNIGYVWNYTTRPAPDVDLLVAVATGYADRCEQTGFWLTNGAQWYLTTGDTNDWAYGRFGTMDFTVELSARKEPPVGELESVLDAHLPAVLSFLGQPLEVRGRVVDRATGQPVEATVSIAGAVVAVDPVTGAFARPSTADRVDMDVVAPGYAARTVAVATYEDVVIALEPDGLQAGRLDPALAAPGTVTRLPVLYTGAATVWRTGADPTGVDVADGALVVPALAPGPWSVTLEDGRTWNRALFVPDDGPASADQLAFDGGRVFVGGDGFATGTRAYAIAGAQRSLIPVTVVAESPWAVTLDGEEIPPDLAFDLLIVSNGTQIAILDAQEARDLDPWEARGDDDGAIVLAPAGCSCDGTVPGWPPSNTIIAWIPLLLLRRRHP